MAVSGAGRAHKPSRSQAISTLLSLGSFLHQLLHAVGLRPLNCASDSRLPGSVVFREAFLCVDVDVHISHVTLACVFVAKGGTTSSSGTVGKLAVEQVWGCGHHPYGAHGQATAGGAESAGQRWRVTVPAGVLQCWEYVPASGC